MRLSLNNLPIPKPVLLTGVALLALFLLRVFSLLSDPNSLYADETQYWIWSRTLDWGYFSKPPMIAWIIATTTAIFGNADWAVRISAPLLHTGTALWLGLAGARLFNREVGMWSALTYATIPAVWLSSSIISTDAVLLFFWSGALYALARLRQDGGWASAVGLGLALGCAFLSKYAAIYLLIGSGLALLIDAPSRKALISLKGALAALIFGLILLPNILWNADHEFATVSHTAANANWGSDKYNFDELAQFVTDQLGVFGPALFITLIAGTIFTFKEGLPFSGAHPRRLLIGFFLPALLVVTTQAFISRAHANWAASAYAAGSIFVVVMLLRGQPWRRWVLIGSIGLHSLIGLFGIAMALSPALAEGAGLGNAFKRVRMWPETASALSEYAAQDQYSALAFDNRNDFHQMQRYATGIDTPLTMWVRYSHAQNHAEAGWPLSEDIMGPVLIVSERPEEVPVMARDFDQFEPVGEIRLPIGAGRERHYQLFRAEGYHRIERTPEYEAEIKAERDALKALEAQNRP